MASAAGTTTTTATRGATNDLYHPITPDVNGEPFLHGGHWHFTPDPIPARTRRPAQKPAQPPAAAKAA